MAIKTITCPDCRGEGYIGNGENGECTRCTGTGSITDGYVFTADSWLYLPDSQVFINPAHIQRIYKREAGEGSVTDWYTIRELDTILNVTDHSDVEALVAWLEARS